MSDHAEKIGKLEVEVGVLKGSIGSIEKGFEHQRKDVGKLFDGQKKIEVAIVESATALHEKLPCGRNTAKIEALEKKTNGHDAKLGEVSAAVGVESGEIKKATGWVDAIKWGLNILIAIAAVIIAVIALKNGAPVP